MIKRSRNDFIQVSYFSKFPFFVRFTSLLIAITLLVILECLLINSLSNLVLLQLVSLLLFLTTLVWILKNWIMYRKQFNNSPFNKLKRFIVQNKLYEEEMRVVGTNGNGSSKKEKVIFNSAYFLYKETKNGELIIRAWKRADKFSDKANTYDTLLSALFGLPLYKKIDDIQYCDYVFELIPDTRITLGPIDNSPNNYQIDVSSKINWRIGSPPHLLVVGGTGSGKTYLVNSLLLTYLNNGSILYIADPKASDLATLGKIINVQRTATTENEIAKLLREANEEMESRYRTYFATESSFGKTWRDITSLKPLVLVFDEFAAFASVSNSKVNKEVQSYLFNLILKGRQAGIEVIMIMQRPDANLLNGNIRDQFGVRIGLGNMTDDGRKMLFGSIDMEYKTIQNIGGGFIMIDGQHNTPIYFESPLIDKDFDFLKVLKNIVQSQNLEETSTTIEIERQTP